MRLIGRHCCTSTALFSAFFLFLVWHVSALADLPDNPLAWTEVYPGAREGAAMAFDAARNRLVLFGGHRLSGVEDNTTWEWDGQKWLLRATTGPGKRYHHAMAYDSEREVVVLFGGLDNSTRLGDTWEWDGSSWTQRSPETSPPARYWHAMVYDSLRQRTVLYGGADSPHNSVTWEWDGQNWTQAAASGPGGRYYHVMGFDPARGRTILFGGDGLNDTWEWDGSSWTETPILPENRPLPLQGTAVYFDLQRNKFVMFGGYNAGYRNYTWEYDGSSWQQVPSSGSVPRPLYLHLMTYDPLNQRALLWGGRMERGVPTDWTALDYSTELFASTDNNWSVVEPAPPQLADPVMVYHEAANKFMLFGGCFGYYCDKFISDTWTFDDNGWTKLDLAGPVLRSAAPHAYDRGANQTLLFGGFTNYANGTFRSDTWIWSDSSWNEVVLPVAPPAGAFGAATYDSDRNVLWMYGGRLNNFSPTSALWKWDGSGWTQILPESGADWPPALYGHGFAWDENRHAAVLYGGRNESGYPSGSTWEFDGTSWTRALPPNNPPALAETQLVYDAARQRVMLFGGSASNALWEWDGNDWIDRTIAGPRGISQHKLVYDPSSQSILMYGGRTSDTGLGEMWRLALRDSDGDGTPDEQDACPEDPLKADTVGQCGCGIPDTDTDFDGAADCNEECDSDPLKTDPGQCGCNVPDIDDDGDGSMNCLDNCPSDPQKTEAGLCGCGVADTDSDGDGTPDCSDLCPADLAKTAPGVCGCGTADVDSGGNGVLDCLDAGIQSITPAAPKLKLTKKKTVSVTMTAAQGVKYAISYKWLTGNKKKDKKAKTKNLLSLSPSATVRGAKIGLQLVLSYHYLVDGPATFRSLESRQVKLKVKKFPKK